jgi:hypothetical protein
VNRVGLFENDTTPVNGGAIVDSLVSNNQIHLTITHQTMMMWVLVALAPSFLLLSFLIASVASDTALLAQCQIDLLFIVHCHLTSPLVGWRMDVGKNNCTWQS